MHPRFPPGPGRLLEGFLMWLISDAWRTREEAHELLEKKHGWTTVSVDAVLAAMARAGMGWRSA